MSQTQATADPTTPVQLFVAIRAAASVMADTRQADKERYAASADRLMHLCQRAEETGLMREVTDFLNVTYRGDDAVSC